MSTTTADDTALTHRQILTILGGLMMAMFLAALDQTIVSTAMRTIADDLGGFSIQAWATTAFLITSTIATPLYGKLSDIYGRKPFILFAIGIFILGSVLCGLAGSVYQLAAFRAVQGIGAGGLFSLAFAIIGDVVPPRERAKYQGYFLAVFGTSSVLGPVLGGFFAGADSILGVTGWRWIFYINVPIALAAFLVVMRVLHIPHRRQDHRIDWPGALALVVCLVPLLTVAEQGREWGWGSGRSLLCYGIGAVGLVLFLIAEWSYKDEALLPLRLFRGRTFSVASTSSFILGIAMFGGLLTLPLYLQIVKGATPTEAGLMLLPLVLGIMTGSIVSGQVIARTGKYRKFPIIGSLLMVAALALFSRIGADTPLWQTMLVMALMGLGLGGNMQPVITAAQNAANPREIGVATSTVTFFRSMGGTVGAAVFLSVLFSLLPEKIKAAFTAAQSTPEFQAAARAHPEQLQGIQRAGTSGSASAFNDTSFVNDLTAALAHPFKVGFSDSMSVVFMVAAAIMVVGFCVILFLPEIPLRSLSAAQQRAQEDARSASSSAGAAPASAAAPAAGSSPAAASPDGGPSPAGAAAAGGVAAGGVAAGGAATGGPSSGGLGAGASPVGASAAGARPAGSNTASSANGGSTPLGDSGTPGNGSGAPTSTFTTATGADGLPTPDGDGFRSTGGNGFGGTDGHGHAPAGAGAHAADGVAESRPDHAPHHAAGAHEGDGVAAPHDDVQPRHSR
ncbi:MFS transporter [Dactylosporangium aurantiacum]|uniref:MFS transporter n=1 Tax=Dactylosporangium aurantiacum TaxID=35754 RepID=A0A9Q9MBY4_9ACTN|nr:MDR family MFS transporter [Dactylosporangium aurantiacum]MDG6109708.1 MDR family MFS transporter [Dactylosporangium aurantiacum]UWZ50319.1 MFS transporter [Dactylosporangium aurantiacum]